ncbi:DUF6177 family protein [Nocardiopsis potens]|uniref:DUF6177 family protein n=1 Tax=Nocardiopsis potens TaxID=1246458 RepID=UPI000344D810|nr:DUF6177 family protein [Nocardiopsis potens]
MSYDVVALVAKDPDMRAIAHALQDAAPEAWLRPLSGGNVLQIRSDERHVLATLEPAQLVESPDEIARLLGPEAAVGLPEECWWVEVRARPDEEGREIAHRLADSLAWRLGGTVWTSGKADFSSWEETDHPAVERIAEKAFVVAQDREVVPFSSWLSDALSKHAPEGKALQVLTPAASRITYPLRTLLATPAARWVVQTEEGTHFDGISGLPLHWNPEEGYIPTPSEDGPQPAPGFLDDSPLGTQLILDLTIQHGEPYAPPLGRAVEIITDHLADSHPAGWGPHEPALAPWVRERLIRLCRHRALRPSVLHFSAPQDGGRPFSGSLRVTWNGEKGAEHISMAIGYEEEAELPLAQLPSLVEALVEEELLTMLHVRRMRGRSDTTYEPRWHGLPVPLGMAVGPATLHRAGAEHALSGPLKGLPLGDREKQAVWYPISESPLSSQARTERIKAQLQHLSPRPTEA